MQSIRTHENSGQKREAQSLAAKFKNLATGSMETKRSNMAASSSNMAASSSNMAASSSNMTTSGDFMTTNRGPGGGLGGLQRMKSLTSMKAMSQRIVRKTRRVVTGQMVTSSGQMMTSSSTESLSGVGQVATSSVE